MKIRLNDICRIFVCSCVVGSLAVSSFAQAPTDLLPLVTLVTSSGQSVEMSDTYKSYQKTLFKHLDQLKQKYLSDEFTKDIPNSVVDAENRSEKLVKDSLREYKDALAGATENIQTLEKSVKDFEGQEKRLADIMTNGGVVIGHFSSLQSMSDTCKKYDISQNAGADPETVIKKNYDDSIGTMQSASNRLWNASNQLWGATHTGPAAHVLANTRDERQEHVYEAQHGAYEAVKDLTHLRDAAVSDYESFVNKSKVQRADLEKENKSLQQRCTDVQARLKKAAETLTGHVSKPTVAPVTPALNSPPVPEKKAVKKHRPKPKPQPVVPSDPLLPEETGEPPSDSDGVPDLLKPSSDTDFLSPFSNPNAEH